MKNKWIRTATVLLFATSMIIGINAQPPGGKGMGPKGQAYGPAQGLKFLNLTEEQEEKLSSLRLEHYKEMKPLRAQMAELKARENTLMSQEEIDVKSVNELIDEKSGMMNKIQKMQLNHKLALRDILSDEQQMMLEKKRMMAHRGDGHRGNAYRGNGSRGDGPGGDNPRGTGMHQKGPQRGSQP